MYPPTIKGLGSILFDQVASRLDYGPYYTEPGVLTQNRESLRQLFQTTEFSLVLDELERAFTEPGYFVCGRVGLEEGVRVVSRVIRMMYKDYPLEVHSSLAFYEKVNHLIRSAADRGLQIRLVG